MNFLRETWIVFARAMRLSLRNPVWVVIGLVQPVLYLALFGPLLKQVVGNTPGCRRATPGRSSSPACSCSSGSSAPRSSASASSPSTGPASSSACASRPPTAPPCSSAGSPATSSSCWCRGPCSTLVAIPFGLRAPVGGVLLALLVVAFLGAAFSSLSYAAALRLKSEDALAPLLNGLAIPLLLLSGILLPMSLAPGWLRTLSDVNPLKHVVDGVRAFFRGDLATATAVWGLAWALGLVAVGVLVGTRTFRRESS